MTNVILASDTICWQGGRLSWTGATLSLLPHNNSTSTIPYRYTLLHSKRKLAFESGCADGQGPASRRGSQVDEIYTWLWNFGRPQPRVGGLLVAKTERISRQSRFETPRRAGVTRKARKVAAEEI